MRLSLSVCWVCLAVVACGSSESGDAGGSGGVAGASGTGGSGGGSGSAGAAGSAAGGSSGASGAGGAAGGAAGTSGAAATGGAAGTSGAAGASGSGAGGPVFAGQGMVTVAAGTAKMGCNNGVDSQCDNDEKPYHDVTLDSFDIDILEVSQGQYKACVDASVCTAPSCDYDPASKGTHPVTCVTWDDAVAFCQWKSKRLPTEAEWERACRGNTGRKFPWGTEFNDYCGYANINWCLNDATPIGTHPVGAALSGSLDLTGNAAEWVQDFYDPAYFASSPKLNPQGPSSGPERVHRGGADNTAAKSGRCSSRGKALPSAAVETRGFRCAK